MMGKTATINVRVDEKDKKIAEFVLKQVSLTKSIPFNISLPMTPYSESIENKTSEKFDKMMVQEYHNAEGEHFRLVNEFFNEFRMKIDG